MDTTNTSPHDDPRIAQAYLDKYYLSQRRLADMWGVPYAVITNVTNGRYKGKYQKNNGSYEVACHMGYFGHSPKPPDEFKRWRGGEAAEGDAK